MIEKDDASFNFERKIDALTKIVCSDFSLKCSRPNLITVFIERKINGKFTRIGKANITIENSKKAKWNDLRIGSDNEFIKLPFPVPNPEYQFRRFRNRGIGSKVVQLILGYLSKNGIETVYGEISDVYDVEKATNFWRKNGFTFEPYTKPKGHCVGRIYRSR